MCDIEYKFGVSEHHREAAVALYDQAFSSKFSLAIANSEKRLAIFSACFNLSCAIGAVEDDALVGLLGFQTTQGSLTSQLTPSLLFTHLGIIKGLRALAIFALYDRETTPGTLLLDGITVRDDKRSLGIGGKMLEQLTAYGLSQGYSAMRLDVIDTNPKAKQLYERHGFTATKTERFPYLRWLLGFGASTTMEKRLTRQGLTST